MGVNGKIEGITFFGLHWCFDGAHKPFLKMFMNYHYGNGKNTDDLFWLQKIGQDLSHPRSHITISISKGFDHYGLINNPDNNKVWLTDISPDWPTDGWTYAVQASPMTPWTPPGCRGTKNETICSFSLSPNT